jgi:hypothetical protein
MQRVAGLAFDGDVGKGLDRAAQGRDGQAQADAFLQGDEEGFVRQEELFRRQDGPGLVAAEELMAAAGVLPEGLDGAGDVPVQQDGGAVGQVVEEGGGLVEEQGQVVLDAGRGDAVGDILVNHAAGRIPLEGFPETAAEAGAPGFVHGELPRRQQAHFLHREDGALGVGVEGLDALHFLVEQVDAVGQGGAHGVEVHQPATHAVFTRRHHLGDVGVAGHRHLRAQAVHVELFALLQKEGVGGQESRRGQPVKGRGGGHQGDVGFAAADGVERGQALGDQVLVGREAVVGQGLPVGQQVGAQAGGQPGDLVGEALGVDGVGGDHHQHALSPGQPGNGQGVTGAGDGRQVEALAGLGPAEGIKGGEKGLKGAGGGHARACCGGNKGRIIGARIRPGRPGSCPRRGHSRSPRGSRWIRPRGSSRNGRGGSRWSSGCRSPGRG